MLKTKLDNRLALCAKFVRQGSKLADVGTDHAYLPVWLCRSGRCVSAVASDINPEPLKRGEENIKDAGLADKITVRLGSGLEQIRPDEADDIVIAGMGGELIADIIENCSFAKDGSKHFILQPMTKSEITVRRLCENGFEIIDGECCAVCGKYYIVLLAKYTGKVTTHDETYYYLAGLNPKENEARMQFAKNCVKRLIKQSKGDERFGVIAEKLKLFCE